ncbi:Lrp/AsnC family transcriptional regulator [Streptomyces sp. W16]|uniref:Lrp/AsnC family transcriptional regulator n=1 Tax=Streptomyces sp. W16 TaxID=3076631 RepID=UPI00295BEC5F|nr:Lrp/AsnC family transcriptional regulator [Streptomyces sp. W16]MDV9176249.1 Lrp/AsnC family transcriptional regulator [Streptomyces sp. W16]
METIGLERIDRQLVHALQLDGRASFRRLSEVLDVSEQTVARRYRRLRTSGVLRVVGRTEARRLGQVDWFTRVRCAPEAAGRVAEALARRPGISWVSLVSGGTEIVCVTRARSRQEQDDLLLGKVPRTPRVADVTAHCLLRTFYGGPTGWSGRTDSLAAHQTERLTGSSGGTDGGGGRVALDESDERLLAQLALDGRISCADLARTVGQPESTVRRRLEFLRRSGVLYFDVDIDSVHLGYETEAFLWLTVTPARLAEVGTALARHPEIAFAAATTGPTNIVASVVCCDVGGLYDYLSERIGALEGVRHVETAPVIRSLKRAGTLMHGSLAADRQGPRR